MRDTVGVAIALARRQRTTGAARGAEKYSEAIGCCCRAEALASEISIARLESQWPRPAMPASIMCNGAYRKRA